jgi:tRNA A-37 threonylcarbamoyl transferase component Bud32
MSEAGVGFERITDPPSESGVVWFRGRRTIYLGSAENADIRIADDRQVGTSHLRFDLDPPDCRMAVQAGRPLPRVNGRPTRQAVLNGGDVIQVGASALRLHVENPAAALRNCDARQNADQSDPRRAPTIIGEDASDLPSAAARSTDGDAAGCRPATLTWNLPIDQVEAVRAAAPLVASQTVVIPGYRVVQLIGQGGMGAVYEAIEEATQQRRAVKVLMTPATSDDRIMRLFLREANILSQLDHPRIVQFHEIGWREGQIFIAMEFVSQVDLATLLKQRSVSRRIRLVCGLVAQVLDALAFAHRRGLVHRDVKPSNILVAKQAKRLSAKLADFGLAKSFETAGFSAMTADGEARGTLGYMAPEQRANSRRVKPSADIYSVGVTLFHLLSGRHPFQSAHSPIGMLQSLEAPQIPLEEVLPEAPAELSQIIRRAMAADPEQRFATAREMKKALLPFAAAEHD